MLATEQGQWADAAEALEGRLRIGGGAETLAALQLRLGILYQERLEQPARAVAAFNAALASVRSAEPLDRLATLHRAEPELDRRRRLPPAAPGDGDEAGRPRQAPRSDWRRLSTMASTTPTAP